MSRRGRHHDAREQRQIERALLEGSGIPIQGTQQPRKVGFRPVGIGFPCATSHCVLLPDPDNQGGLVAAVIGGNDPATALAKELFVETHGATPPEECMRMAMDFYDKTDKWKFDKMQEEIAKAEAEAASEQPVPDTAPGEQVTEGGIVLP